jgi:hypothetical protein
MPPATNLSATRRTIRRLREQERLTEEHAGMIRLAECLAAQLDQVVADGSAKRYVVATIAREHRATLSALLAVESSRSDGLAAVLAYLSIGDEESEA